MRTVDPKNVRVSNKNESSVLHNSFGFVLTRGWRTLVLYIDLINHTVCCFTSRNEDGRTELVWRGASRQWILTAQDRHEQWALIPVTVEPHAAGANNAISSHVYIVYQLIQKLHAIQVYIQPQVSGRPMLGVMRRPVQNLWRSARGDPATLLITAARNIDFKHRRLL